MNDFTFVLVANIRAKIIELRRDGTTAMGVENLLQVTKTPSASLPGAPASPAAYRQLFRQVCRESKIISLFTCV